MARTVDPARKLALLADIVDFLLDRPLSTVTFRTLAEGIGVSTYTLVYHFGTKAGMVRDIVETTAERQRSVLAMVAEETGDLDAHLANLRSSWRLTLQPRNTKILRLEFEAALHQSHDGPRAISRAIYERWLVVGVDSLLTMGISREDAEREIRLIVDTLYGLQFDLIMTGQAELASAAFDVAVEAYERRLRRLIADSPRPARPAVRSRTEPSAFA